MSREASSMRNEDHFFVEEEPALAAQLTEFLARLSADLGAQAWSGGVVALVLAGGYGRGEGGVFRTTESGPAQLYNDLEFFMFLRPRADETAARQWCEAWERSGTRELGIDVEFKREAARVLRGGAPTMFWHDLLQGHRVVWGNAQLFETAPEWWRDPSRLPMTEATRLLFNRGSGLWFAQLRLEAGSPTDLGFVERNQQKARLALGDAVLAGAGRHHGLCQVRAQRLGEGGFAVPPSWGRIMAWHAEGVAFKLRPRHRATEATALTGVQGELTAVWLETFLWLEERRLGRKFHAPLTYVKASGRLFPDESRVRNGALHARDRLKYGDALPDWLDYPRAALQRGLVAALAGEPSEAALALGCEPYSLTDTYARWWARYN